MAYQPSQKDDSVAGWIIVGMIGMGTLVSLAVLALVLWYGTGAYPVDPPYIPSVTPTSTPHPPRPTETPTPTTTPIPAFSSFDDAGIIAFISDREMPVSVWLSTADGSEQTRLTYTELPTIQEMSWTPDGKYLLLYTTPYLSSEIYLVSVPDGHVELISDVRPFQPFVWSAEGHLRVKTYEGQLANLHMPTQSEPAHVEVLPTPPAGVTDDICWSPDLSHGIYNTDVFALKLVMLDVGAGQERPFFEQHGNNLFTCQWSPDGSRILLTLYDDNGYFGALHTINIDGTGLTRISPDQWHIRAVRWSPDSRRIALIGSTEMDLRQQALYTMNADGSDFKMVMPPEMFHTVSASPRVLSMEWFPDGTRLLLVLDDPEAGFQSDEEDSAAGDSEILVLQVEDGSVTRLTDNSFSDDEASIRP